MDVSMSQVFLGTEDLCDVLETCLEVSRYLLDRAPVWLDDL
jgi:hypothetical protein